MSTLNTKRVLVTGANGGLGLATCAKILEEGASVLLACRTADRAEAARRAALAATGADPGRAVAAGGFDMLDPEAIAAAVDALPADPIDVVFLQAGGWVWSDVVQTVEIGGQVVERTVATNVLGAHATVRSLLSSGRLARGARIVIIGGEGARGVPGGITKPAFDDIGAFERYLIGDVGGRPYVPVDALGVAKLCAALWARQLAERVDGAFEVLWFSPGLIGGTGGTAGLPVWKEWLFQRVAFPILIALGKAQWPDQAAAKCVDCLAGRVGDHGDLLGAPAGRAIGPLTDQTRMQPLFDDPDFQAAMWRTCEAAVGPIAAPKNTRQIA